MAAALECWSSRPSMDEEMLEQVLMRSGERSEVVGGDNASSAAKTQKLENNNNNNNGVKDAVQKKWHKLGRNVAGAISTLKSTLNLDNVSRDAAKNECKKVVWGSVLKNLTRLYPGSQLPEKLISNIRKHFDSMPLSYAQSGFDMKEVFLHIRLIEQATEDHPAVFIQEQGNERDPSTNASDSPKSNSAFSDEDFYLFKITFACNSIISWPSVTCALENAGISFKEIQLFEKKNFTLGIIIIQCSQEKCSKTKIESALKAAIKKPRAMKLTFGLCGCEGRDSLGQASTSAGLDEETLRKPGGESTEESHSPSKEFDFDWDCPAERSLNKLIEMPHLGSSFTIVVDEWQTICSGKEELGRWLVIPEEVEFVEQITSTLFKGTYKGRKVALRKLRGCERGSSYEVEFRKDILELMTCGHRNILPFYGICIDDTHGMYTITKLMDGGSLHELIQKSKRIQLKDVIRIAIDIAEGTLFLNDHGVAHRDLNTTSILLDKQGNAAITDIGMVQPCKILGEVVEYETGGYKWLAPENLVVPLISRDHTS
ncbi:uncharacterized protein LOC131071206 isoform X2 [Cryptomeria japonica]|uniref:uncharacterized protein LOC131071206 isoform X2 n=1 Tax=Cryptomeria japonica TaxID=3369 RepID=UPI0025ACF6EC|nr:uncharacterized protein LOC131071206 isoform X2 [Cryptomeria japonica]